MKNETPEDILNEMQSSLHHFADRLRVQVSPGNVQAFAALSGPVEGMTVEPHLRQPTSAERIAASLGKLALAVELLGDAVAEPANELEQKGQ